MRVGVGGIKFFSFKVLYVLTNRLKKTFLLQKCGICHETISLECLFLFGFQQKRNSNSATISLEIFYDSIKLIASGKQQQEWQKISSWKKLKVVVFI